MGFFGRWQLLFGKCYSHFSIVPRFSFLRSLLAPHLPLILSLFFFFFSSTLYFFFFHDFSNREKKISLHFFSHLPCICAVILTNFFFSLLFFFCEKETYFSMPHISLKDIPVSELFHFSFSFFFPPFSFLSSFVNFFVNFFLRAFFLIYVYIYLSLSLSVSVHNRELSPRHPSNPPVLDVFPRQCTYGASYIRDNGIFLVESNLLEITFHRDYLAFRRFDDRGK